MADCDPDCPAMRKLARLQLHIDTAYDALVDDDVATARRALGNARLVIAEIEAGTP